MFLVYLSFVILLLLSIFYFAYAWMLYEKNKHIFTLDMNKRIGLEARIKVFYRTVLFYATEQLDSGLEAHPIEQQSVDNLLKGKKAGRNAIILIWCSMLFYFILSLFGKLP